MTTATSQSSPRAWLAAEVEADLSWIQRLDAEAVAGFDGALKQAMSAGKPYLSMTQADFPLNDAARRALDAAIGTTQGRWGMCLLKGFPVDRWTEDETRMAVWGMSLYMGVARTQNRASQIMNDVRDEGGSYKVKGGRGYNTNAGLDFHQDSCDVVALLCRRTAKSGGMSKVVSSIAVVEEVRRRRPDLVPVLQGDWWHSYQGAQDPAQPPFYCCPILGGEELPFAMRTNRKNIDAAQRDFTDAPRLSKEQLEVLSLLEEIMADPRFCYSMELEQGDMQLLNSFVTLHSRTPFEDFEEPDRKRHLFRLWMSLPSGQQLPASWAEYWGDVRAGSVRGGVRGSAITAEFLEFEQRQAEAMGMKYQRWSLPNHKPVPAATTA